MSEPLAYLNGQLIPASQAAVPVYDTGFVQGVTVAEQLRTFRGKLFRLDHHIQRLAHSLEIVGIQSEVGLPQLAEAAQDLVARNHALLADGDDLGLSMFITPGMYPTFSSMAELLPSRAGPTVCMHTYLLPFHLWADLYERGQSLVITDVEQVPAACWPPELKCRSRMHYYLADRQARLIEPGSRALLLDAHGQVSESSTANVVIYRRDEGLTSPPREKILPGISMAVLEELAAALNIPFVQHDLSPDDVAAADEVILSSTSPCLLPVVRLNGRPIGSGTPGDVFRSLLAAWSQLVGVDIAAQAARFGHR